MAVRRLNDEVRAQWDRYQQLGEDAKQFREMEAERKSLKESILAALGDATQGRLPDGRVLARIEKSRTMRARDAEVQTWQELVELA